MTRIMVKKKYIAPNVITAGNMFLGYISIIESIKGHFIPAIWFIILAMVCDGLDGKTARKLDAFSSKMIDLIQEGIDEAKGIFIITSKPKEMKTAIIEQIGRGVTFLHGEGGFSGENLKILYCVVGKYQLLSLKKIVKDLDSQAFVTVTNVHEVLGNGFKKLQEEEKKAD